MFDYKLLEAFAATIDQGGFEKAAQLLHISQSAVSQRIKLLEETRGQILLTRTTPPTPTNKGRDILAHYRQVKHLEEVLEKTQNSGFDNHITFSIGINADSLATWFLPCVKEFSRNNQIIFDLHIDDQEQTFDLLRKGMVWGCVSTRKTSAHGCRVTSLGTMKYIVCSTPAFRKKWFPEGLNQNNASRTPIMRYNRNDFLNDIVFTELFTDQKLNRTECFVPSSEKFFEFILSGIAYGIVPLLQCKEYLQDHRLVNLAPELDMNVPLFWHCWNVQSSLMKAFTNCLANESHLF